MQMSGYIEPKQYDEDKYFKSQLFFFSKQDKDKDQLLDQTDQRLSYDPNGTPQAKFKECLPQGLLDSIEKPSPLVISKSNEGNYVYEALEEVCTSDNSLKEVNGLRVMNSAEPINAKPKKPTKKGKKKSLKEREGDWTCYFCQNLNFAFRQKCNRCFALKLHSDQSHDAHMKAVLNIINENEKIRQLSNAASQNK